MVDWSAASVPKLGRDSIWMARQRIGSPQPAQAPLNFSTRELLLRAVVAMGEQANATGGRLLVGFDFAFAFPAGTAAALGRDVEDPRPPWLYTMQTIAQLITDDDTNRNNRFQVGAQLNLRIAQNLDQPIERAPFWGRLGGGHSARTLSALPVKKPVSTCLPQWRRVEGLLKSPQPGWKLAYAGSAGGQTLMGMHYLVKLRERFGDTLAIWPFEPVGPDTAIILAEIYPSYWPLKVQEHQVKDANQVVQVCRELSQGDLAQLTQTANLQALDLEEEGWVLGVPPH